MRTWRRCPSLFHHTLPHLSLLPGSLTPSLFPLLLSGLCPFISSHPSLLLNSFPILPSFPFSLPLSRLPFFILLPLLCSLSLHPSLHLSQAWLIGRWVVGEGWSLPDIGPLSRPGKWSMLNLILNTPSLTPAGSGDQHLATQLGQPNKTYGSSLTAGVFMCLAVLLEK